MTLTLKPKGRGNWRPMKMTLTGVWADCLIFDHGLYVGATLRFGGITFRICKVSA